MAKRNSINVKTPPELKEAYSIKQENIRRELSRISGFSVKKPTLIDVQRYIASELKNSGVNFNVKKWEKIVNT